MTNIIGRDSYDSNFMYVDSYRYKIKDNKDTKEDPEEEDVGFRGKQLWIN